MENTNPFEPVIREISDKIKTQVSELHELAQSYKASNGTPDAINTWIAESTDPEIIAMREGVAKALAKVAEVKADMAERAKAALVPDGFDPNAIQKDFKQKKTETTVFIKQSIGVLGTMGVDKAELEEFDQFLSELPSLTGVLTGSGRSPEQLSQIREWAKENGHDVAEKGRIAKSILEAYDAAHTTSVKDAE